MWGNLTKKEQDEYANLSKKISKYISDLENVRLAQKKKLPTDNLEQPICPSDEEFIRWDRLWWKLWRKHET